MGSFFEDSSEANNRLRTTVAKKVSMLNRDPVTRSVMEKIVAPPTTAYGNNRSNNHDIGAQANQLLRKVSDITAMNAVDSSTLMQLLPDMKKAMSILVSSIISPNDMVSRELNYIVEDFDGDSATTGALLEIVVDYFKKDYKIEGDLEKMLEDALFRVGSYPIVVLPESEIDSVINSPNHVTMESLSDTFDTQGRLKSKHILGPSVAAPRSQRSNVERGLGMETINIDVTRDIDNTVVKVSDGDNVTSLVTVSDNVDTLKLAKIRKRMVDDRLESAYKPTGPDDVKLAELLDNAIYKNRRYSANPTIGIKDTSDRDNVGHPLVMKLPAESVIPVHVPGNPREHVAYFILLDPVTGTPLNSVKTINQHNEMGYQSSAGKEQISSLLSSLQVNANGIQRNQIDAMDTHTATQAYQNIIERDLKARLANGVYGEGVAISSPQEVWRVMFSRALARQATQILFVPASLMTYIAFDHNEWGAGKSLLEDTKILASIRAMLLFANTMAEIKNSITHENVKIELDPNDPAPANTVEFLMHEVSRQRKSQYPVTSSNPIEMINYLQNAGIKFSVSGHEGYPVTNLDVDQYSTSRVEINTNLSDNLRKIHLTAVGVPPETVDTSEEAEFATTIARNNLLFTKLVIQYQEIFTEFLTKFVRTYTFQSSILMDRMRKVIEANLKTLPADIQRGGVNRFLSEFLRSLHVRLPSPDTVQLESLLENYETYKKALEEWLDQYINQDFLNDMSMGEVSTPIDTIKAALKARYLRKWLRDNSAMPELEDLLKWDDDSGGVSLLDEYDRHIDGLSKAILPFIQKINARKAAIDPLVDAVGGVDGASSNNDTSDSEDNDTTGDSDDLDMDMGGDDDLDMDTDDSDAEGSDNETDDSGDTEGAGDADDSDDSDAAEKDDSSV